MCKRGSQNQYESHHLEFIAELNAIYVTECLMHVFLHRPFPLFLGLYWIILFVLRARRIPSDSWRFLLDGGYFCLVVSASVSGEEMNRAWMMLNRDFYDDDPSVVGCASTVSRRRSLFFQTILKF